MKKYVTHGDCLVVLPTLDADSVDSVVTDPPYHLTSIVKRFGSDGAAPAKFGTDGAYARASAGFMGKQWDGGDVATRPETWAAVMRVMKPGAYLLSFGGTRTFHRVACAIEDAGFEIRDTLCWLYGSGFPKSHNLHGDWEGRGTALKPAFEPIILARKPLGEKTVAANVLKWGTGALNIDTCRVGTDTVGWGGAAGGGNTWNDGNCGLTKNGEARPVVGRWPANVLHDGSDEVIAAFPDSKGQLAAARIDRGTKTRGVYSPMKDEAAPREPRGDFGSAARFFYCAKASKSDRNEGVEGRNNHPTVKPESLMRYIARLVTPPKGIVLDPFTGSGSTGKAAILEGFDFLGIEKEAEYLPIAEARISAAVERQQKDLFS